MRSDRKPSAARRKERKSADCLKLPLQPFSRLGRGGAYCRARFRFEAVERIVVSVVFARLEMRQARDVTGRSGARTQLCSACILDFIGDLRTTMPLSSCWTGSVFSPEHGLYGRRNSPEVHP